MFGCTNSGVMCDEESLGLLISKKRVPKNQVTEIGHEAGILVFKLTVQLRGLWMTKEEHEAQERTAAGS